MMTGSLLTLCLSTHSYRSEHMFRKSWSLLTVLRLGKKQNIVVRGQACCTLIALQAVVITETKQTAKCIYVAGRTRG